MKLQIAEVEILLGCISFFFFKQTVLLCLFCTTEGANAASEMSESHLRGKSAPEMTSNISNLERILVEINSRRRQGAEFSLIVLMRWGKLRW